jgi:DNA-binding winged helix-turn-helix (wHTH) protein
LLRKDKWGAIEPHAHKETCNVAPLDPALHEGNAQQVVRPVLNNGSIRFRDFEVRPGDRTLLRRRQPVCIGSRAFDLLVVLLRSRGKIVSKDAIIQYVWPSTIVEESNLRFQVASLRRTLGDDRGLIKSIPGRGYLFASDQDLDQEGDAARLDELDSWGGVPPRTAALARDSVSAFPDRLGNAGTVAMGDEALELFFRTAGKLVAAYGSIDAVIGALVERRT